MQPTMNLFFFAAAVGKAMYDMLVVQSFRPDRLVASGTLFVKAALGEDFFHASEEELNLGMIVQTEVNF